MSSRLRSVAALSLSASLLLAAGCGGAADRKDRYLQRGDQYFAEQNYDKARVEYTNALQIDPKSVKGRFALGQIAERAEKPRDALANYQAAVDIDPAYHPARAALARVYLLGGLKDKALEIIEPGLALAPEDPQLRTIRGAIRAQSGDDAGALADAEAAVKAAPTDELALALIGSLYRKAGRAAEAIGALEAGVAKLPRNTDLRIILADLERSADRNQDAERHLAEVIAIEPKVLAHRQRLARFHLMNRDAASAERVMREAVKAVPDSVDTKLALVQLLSTQQGIEKGEAQMLEFIQSEPGNADLKLAMGRFYEATGKVDKADAMYQQLVATDGVKPKALEARDRQAALAVQKGDTGRAEKLLAEVLAKNPRDNEALAMRGQLALLRGDATAAITDLRAVLRDQPNATAVMRALARAHLQNNETALAEETLRAAVQASPKDVPARMDLVMVLANAGKTDVVRPMLEQLIVDAPAELPVREAYFRVQYSQADFAGALHTAEDIRLLRPDLPLGLMFSGQVKEAQKKYEAAAADYDAAQKIKADSTDPLVALVRLDMIQQQPKRAMARLATVLEKAPDNVMVYNLQGEVLVAQAQYDSAIKAFSEAIQRTPNWWIAYRGKAQAQRGAKRLEEAAATLALGVEKTGGSVPLTAELAGLQEQLGHHDEAIKVYEDLLKRSPNMMAAANNLAMLLVNHRSDKGSLDRAGQLADSLASATAPLLLDTRGWVKFKQGEFQQAVGLLQQAADKNAAVPEIRYHLGMAYYKSGNLSAARENLEAALKSGIRFPGADEAQTVLTAVRPKG